MTTTLNVAKFGGTSVANYETMCSCAKIIANNPNTRVVVVSAAAGVTNHLVALANTPLTSVQIDDIVQKITDIELAIVNRLKHPEDVQEKLTVKLEELKALATNEEINFRDDLKDALLSMGERMSSLLFSAVLREFEVPAINFDVRKVLRTNSTFTNASPEVSTIKQLSHSLLLPELSHSVMVTQGFVGADDQGRTTTLGRGGSDFTAALLAEAIEAETCEIWTDVIGVYTTDPRITDKAKPLPELSFEEAAEMATFGAKVLHPATMEPALRQNIKVFVGSSREPEKGGTWIVRDCEHEPSYRAITRRKDQVMVTVKTPKMMYAQGFLQRVFTIIAKHQLSVDLVTTSEISVSFTLDNPPNTVSEKMNKETLAELTTICDVSVEQGFDLVTVVGNNMHSAAGVSSKIFAAISDFNLRMICFGANPHNLSFVVSNQDSEDVVKVLHNALFE
ncbi:MULTISPECIES: lysine-sensitive aspartokinase 3 [Alteromonadaceae]|jgi:aspartate kinase|uniref:Aspartokinase n=1 Tax=Brumicola blandensis TaxID=3075611 RepID=A0AAW8R880_9ALTE|nr:MULTISPECIES: lysine-sensitive aspartokinase 3 [unclassified Alteromonas]MDT0584331.1 lysine-sensitive aspartokinase 3 [Alteromonas sp. W409]MDT0629775.1 lysine-sensitive aspartokinase 3 [Alteromonas sp. W364]